MLCLSLPASAGEALTIGLVFAGDDELVLAREAVVRGARLAVKRIDREGDASLAPIRLLTSSSDGPWGGFTSEIARLVYDESAVALIGALGGRSAHIAAQVITRAKGQALFITPWASEATLARINVPWFCRAVPDDVDQAEVLAKALEERGSARAAVWVGESYDARAGAEALFRAVPGHALGRFGSSGTDLLAGALRSGGYEVLVVYDSPSRSAHLVKTLRQAAIDLPIFGPLSLTGGDFLNAAGSAAEGVYLVAPAHTRADTTAAAAAFRREYRALHGTPPPVPAYYAHDALLAVSVAAKSAKGRVGDLAGPISQVSFEGVTGRVEFGGREDGQCYCGLPPILAVVTNGILIPSREPSAAKQHPSLSRLQPAGDGPW